MRVLLAFAMLAVLLSDCAMAETLAAVRPGVMCVSAEALAKLTRPDGSSKSASPDANATDKAEEQAGGCIEIPSGARVEVQRARRNTSIVTFDAHDGRGARSFFVANIDFAAASATDPAEAGSTHAHVPEWPDGNYPPLVNTFKLLDAVKRRCPQQGWTEHTLSHTEAGPWGRVDKELTPAQQNSIEKETERQCQAGLSCPADIDLGMEVQMGHEAELVRLICSVRPDGDL